MNILRRVARARLAPQRPDEGRYRSLFEHAREGMMIVDAGSGRVLEVNACLLDLLGYASEELLGRNLWRLGLFVDLAAMRSLRGVLKHNGVSRHFDLAMVRKGGQSIEVDFLSSVFDSADDSLILCTLRDVTARTRMLADLQRAATTDCLTGTANRWHFLESAKSEWRRSRRYARPLSVAALDADHFKSINDRFGHHVGDQVLRAIADACRRTIRSVDLTGRIGGEEFAILMPETPLQAAIEAAQRVLVAIHDIRVLQARDDGPLVTASIGVATSDESQSSLEDLMIIADERLYMAKESGRDQVCPAAAA